ncbi:hypothetical protein JOD63_002489 [Microbacterium terrae]|uniref:DUF2975 domain-containing protein n=1 Tax=Microbacterium terrae TaxID=69369 RepID=A0A0M2HG34_9MICO|nr:hypothetical protein [Microbacterium terrae]KJL43275.1 hypothetical protein RS81_00879 [Microbacterium terrae]MBP1078521.1 hypothetical protein [Microbacterium terrae]GLJ97921.1 hypothetical protein GCM10017594_11180 [Microbacterium terrae]
MTAERTSGKTWSRADMWVMSFYFFLGAALVIGTIVTAVLRVIEVVGNDGVRVYAEFAGTPAEAPIGPDGAATTVELESAYLLPPELPVASVGALVIEQIVVVLTVVIVVTCLLLLMWNVMRGRMFSRRNTAFVATAFLTGLVGVMLAPFFANMGANGAFAWISERTFDNVILSVDPVQLFGVAFIGSIATTAFSVGDRLRRDTEGLV